MNASCRVWQSFFYTSFTSLAWAAPCAVPSWTKPDQPINSLLNLDWPNIALWTTQPWWTCTELPPSIFYNVQLYQLFCGNAPPPTHTLLLFSDLCMSLHMATLTIGFNSIPLAGRHAKPHNTAPLKSVDGTLREEMQPASSKHIFPHEQGSRTLSCAGELSTCRLLFHYSIPQ